MVVCLFVVACSSGSNKPPPPVCTLHVGVRLAGEATRADSLRATVRYDGLVGPSITAMATHTPSGDDVVAFDVAFPGGYPVGKHATVSVSAFIGGHRIAYATAAPALLSADCDAVTLGLNATALDLVSFAIARQFDLPGGGGSGALVTADIDGDGQLDAILNTIIPSTPTMPMITPGVAVFLGDGQGGLGQATLAPTNPAHQMFNAYPSDWLAVGDLDGDGRPDVVAVNPYSGDVSVLLNDHGVLSPGVPYDVGGAGPVALADLDGDGALDLAVLVQAGGDPTAQVIVRFNDGHGAFPALMQYPLPVAAAFEAPLVAADVDGDGKSDLVFSVDGTQQIGVLLGRGDGTFAPFIASDAGGAARALAFADLDHDGAPDCVLLDGGAGSGGIGQGGGVYVLRNAGQGRFAPPVAYPPPVLAGVALAVADFDGDGSADLAVGSIGEPVALLHNDGAGTFSAGAVYQTPSTNHALAAGDLDGDGKPDLLVSDFYGVAVLQNAGSGALVAPSQFSPDPAAGMVLADLNGDGKTDIAYARQPSAGGGDNLLVYRGNGDGTLAAPAPYAAGTSPSGIAAGDLDSDGALDLAITDSVDATSGGELLVVHNRGDGTFAAPVRYEVGAYPAGVAVGDLDGDGKRDLVVIVGTSVKTLRNSGNGTFAAAITYDAGTVPSSILVADVNGDGKSDVALAGTDVVNVLVNDGSGMLGAPVTWAVGRRLKLVGAHDLDGDGALDLVVSDNSVGANVSLLFNDGAGGFARVVQWPGSAAAIADVDGDGKVDLVSTFATDPRLDLIVRLNDGSGGFATTLVFPVTLSAALIATADFDGDGRPELVDSNGMLVRNVTP